MTPTGDSTYSVWTPEQVMNYVEALLSERDSTGKAVDDAHERSLVAGTERLRDHVDREVHAIRTALDAADALERERDAKLGTQADERSKASKVQMEELQHQVDRRLDTQLRERNDTERHLQQQVEAARSHADEKTKSLAEKTEAHLRENQRATEMAEREREKAAQALAINLARSIEEGDARLREHIHQQVAQIEAALQAARRETAFAAEAQKVAIGKADTATDKRFDAVNNFRAELSERWEKTMPREVAEAQIAEVKKSVEAITRRLDLQQGGEKVKERAQDHATGWKLAVAGFAVTLFVTFVVIMVNILTAA
jgi:hypothetical protein